MVGLRAWLDVADSVAVALRAVIGSAIGVRLLLSFVNAAKRKHLNAAVGLAIPVVGIVSAFRLAKPDSLWAARYGAEKRARAAKRYPNRLPAPVFRPSV